MHIDNIKIDCDGRVADSRAEKNYRRVYTMSEYSANE